MSVATVTATDFLVPVVYILVLVILAVAFLFLIDRIFRRRPNKAELDAFSKHFQQRLLKPDFEGLEKHFRHTLPQQLKALYNNHAEILNGDFKISQPKVTEDIWYIAYYQPADLDNVRDAWPGKEQVFELANDGCGNGYTVDVRQDDPPVFSYDHETGEQRQVSKSLSEFITMARQKLKD